MSYAGFEYNERGYGGGFDAFGGFAGGMDMGGGFMNEGEGKKSSEKKSRDRQSLMPVSVKQLLTATNHDDVYRVDEVELNIVKLVGTISNAQEHSTNFTFLLNDGSGSIECKLWMEKDSSGMSKIASLRNGTLARVIGNIREYDNKIHVSVYDAHAVQDWNELTYHILDVIYTHCQNTKGPIAGASGFVPNQSSFMHSTPNGVRGGPMGTMGGGTNLNMVMKKESQSLNEAVFNAYLIGSRGNQAGLSYHEALQALERQGLKIGRDQLVASVQQLCNEGRLYTTLDDEHYGPTVDDF